MRSAEGIYLRWDLGRPDTLETFAKERTVRVLRHISWTPPFHTWTPREPRRSFIRIELLKSLFLRQLSRQLDRQWRMRNRFSALSNNRILPIRLHGEVCIYVHARNGCPQSSRIEMELLWKKYWFANTEFLKSKSQQRESQFVASLILLFIIIIM